MARLLTYDENGEAWFDNPSLVLTNPPRRRRRRSFRRNYSPAGYTSARIAAASGAAYGPAFSEGGRLSSFDSSSGAFSKRRRKKGGKKKRAVSKRAHHKTRKSTRKKVKTMATRRRKRTYRRTVRAVARFRVSRRRKGFRRKRTYAGIFRVKSRGMRRRIGGRVRFRVNRRRRHYRNNPFGGSTSGTLRLPFGLSFPWYEAAVTAGGFVALPIISAQIQALVPTTLVATAGSLGAYIPLLVDFIAVVVPGMLIRKYASQKLGDAYLVGAGARFVLRAINTISPSTATSLGITGLGRYFNGQPGLGARNFRAVGRGSSAPALVGAPERLDPRNRF